MSVIVECSVPATDFVLGQVFQASPAAWIELDQLVPTTESIIPFFWVRDDDGIEDPRATADALATAEHVRSVEVLDAFEDRALFRVEWAPEIDGMVKGLVEHDAALLEATGTGERWQFELRFLDTETASGFQTACFERDISLDVRRVHNPTKPKLNDGELTPAQREVVLAALNEGYFEIPRRTTLVDLADQFGISDQAASERMRRAEAKLIRSQVGPKTSPERP